MAQWVRALIIQTQGPEFKSPALMLKKKLPLVPPARGSQKKDTQAPCEHHMMGKCVKERGKRSTLWRDGREEEAKGFIYCKER